MAPKTKRRTQTKREYAEMDHSYKKVSSGGKYRSKKKKRSGKSSAILTVCFSALIILAIMAGSIYLFNADLTGTIADGITVAGVDVGGMTRQEAANAITAATKDTYPTETMVVTVLDSQVLLTPGQTKVKLNISKAVRLAFRQKEAGAVDITDCITLDEGAVQDALTPLGEKYSSTLSQTTYEVTGTAPNQELVVNLGKPEYGLDMNRLYKQVLQAYSENKFQTEGTCEMIEPNPLELQPILDKYYIAPVDATFDTETGEVIEGVDGYGFDLEAAEKTIANAAYGTSVKIPFISIAPSVTADNLTSALYKDELGSYTATSESETDRDTNLRLACEAINGMVVKPGEVFSYNKALGERTAKRGYKPGPTFVNGKTTTTIGGGICQVSSALYNCVLQADLEIKTRKNHGYAVSYVKLGMDAAVSWGSLDFCFANNTSYPIRIEASAKGGETTVKLIGTDEKDYYVEMEYEVLATYGYETTYETMDANNSGGYKNGDYIVEPHTGYSVKTYRCKYSKETKELISKDEEDASYYNKCDAVICQISGSTTPGIGNGGVTDGDGLLP